MKPLTHDNKSFVEQRKYTRLNSNFPVEFTIVRLQGDMPGLDWQQGYTCNVSKGGLCLQTVNISESTIRYLSHENIYLELRIRIPLNALPIKAVGEVAWYQRIEKHASAQYLIGLEFKSIKAEDNARILNQAHWMQYSTKAAVILSAILFFALVIINFLNKKF